MLVLLHLVKVPLAQVGASNELPESEELDALFDRFLIRRQVAQVSSAQLGSLARLAAGTLRPAGVPSLPNFSVDQASAQQSFSHSRPVGSAAT